MIDESNTSLHEAIEQKNLSAVIALIADGADVNCCVNDQTACTKAIYVGDTQIIRKIIESVSFHPDATNQFGQTALIIATKEGKLNFVRKLLQLGATVDQKDELGLTALRTAAKFDQTSIAEILIEHGADVNKTDCCGVTPLYEACVGNRICTAKLLVDRGSDVNISTYAGTNRPGHTPLMVCIEAVHFDISKPVGDIALSNQVKTIRLLLSNGCEVDAQDYRGRTALCFAVLHTDTVAACLLLEAKCSPNVVDKFGITPLHMSLQVCTLNCSLAIVLLLYGADVDCLNPNSGGSKRNFFEMVREIRNKKDVNTGDYCKLIQVLISAVNPWHLETLRNQGRFVHLDYGVSAEQVEPDILEKTISTSELNLQSCCRYTIRRRLERCTVNKIHKLPIPNRLKLYLNLNLETSYCHPGRVNELHLAVRQGDVGAVYSTVQTGTSVEAPFCGKLPLTLAAELGQKEVVHILLELGANPNALDPSGDSALHLAARNAYSDILQVLLLHRPDMELRNKELRTPLLEAAFNGDSTTIMILLQAGSDPTVSQKRGITSLHYMAGHGNSEIVSHLLDMNVDPDVMDSSGYRPIHIAASKGRNYYPAFCPHANHIDPVGVIRALVGAGCDVRARPSRGWNALLMSKIFYPSNNPELVGYLTDLFN